MLRAKESLNFSSCRLSFRSLLQEIELPRPQFLASFELGYSFLQKRKAKNGERRGGSVRRKREGQTVLPGANEGYILSKNLGYYP